MEQQKKRRVETTESSLVGDYSSDRHEGPELGQKTWASLGMLTLNPEKDREPLGRLSQGEVPGTDVWRLRMRGG